MPWEEFKDLLTGLGPDTPLGRIVQIRTEDDEEAIKYFTKEQREIRNKWRNKVAKQRSREDVQTFLDSMLEAFKNMAGDQH